MKLYLDMAVSLHDWYPTQKQTQSDFQQCGILISVDSDEYVQSHFKLEIPNDVRSVAQQS